MRDDAVLRHALPLDRGLGPKFSIYQHQKKKIKKKIKKIKKMHAHI